MRSAGSDGCFWSADVKLGPGPIPPTTHTNLDEPNPAFFCRGRRVPGSPSSASRALVKPTLLRSAVDASRDGRRPFCANWRRPVRLKIDLITDREGPARPNPPERGSRTSEATVAQTSCFVFRRVTPAANRNLPMPVPDLQARERPFALRRGVWKTRKTPRRMRQFGAGTARSDRYGTCGQDEIPGNSAAFFGSLIWFAGPGRHRTVQTVTAAPGSGRRNGLRASWLEHSCCRH